MYKLKYFEPCELLPPEVPEKNLYDVFDVRTLMTIDVVRCFFDAPVIVNTWRSGGKFCFRGFRPSYYTKCAMYSQHKFGRAIDCDIKGYTAEEARKTIIENKEKFPYITRLETGVNWLHFDLKYTGFDKICLFRGIEF